MEYGKTYKERAQNAETAVRRLRAKVKALRKDAALGRFVRLHMTERPGGWSIAQTFIHGAPSLEDVTDALPPVR